MRQPVGRPRPWPAELLADKGPQKDRVLHQPGRNVTSSNALEWLTRFLRLARRNDRIGAHFEAFAVLACAIIFCHRTIRTDVLLTPNCAAV